LKSSLFYHPQRIIVKNSAIIMDSAHYSSMEYFVEILEEKVPQCLSDLENLSAQYASAVEWFQKQGLTGYEEPSLWEIVNQSDTNIKYAGYLPLKEGLLSWIEKYSLYSSSEFYVSLALWSVEVYYKQCLDTDRKQRSERMKVFIEKHGISEEQYWSLFPCEPYKEVLSLSEQIVYTEDIDTEELYKSVAPKRQVIDEELFFNNNFPFIFAPNNHFSIFNWKATIDDYEGIVHHTRKEEASTKPQFIPPFNGTGWDPRVESWREFEKKIDSWYEQYKLMYKERAEYILEENGYIRSKAKRNLEHFNWLIYYQVLGWSLKEIADKCSEQKETVLSEDTIWKGIQSAAEVVHIILR